MIGGQLRFFTPGVAGTYELLTLPAAQWIGLGNPVGSKGYKYHGAGSVTDPCRSVVVTTKTIKASCRGPNSFDSPSPYDIPIGVDGAAWEMIIGSDRYCALSAASTAAIVKRSDGSKGKYKAVKALAPATCPAAATPTPSPSPSPTPSPSPSPTPTPTPTPPYGSASRAFTAPSVNLLR